MINIEFYLYPNKDDGDPIYFMTAEHVPSRGDRVSLGFGRPLGYVNMEVREVEYWYDDTNQCGIQSACVSLVDDRGEYEQAIRAKPDA